MDPDPSSSILILALSLLASAFFSGMNSAKTNTTAVVTMVWVANTVTG